MKNRIAPLVSALAGALFMGLPLAAQAPHGSLDRLPDPRTLPAAKLVAPQPKVQSFKLPNGLRVLFTEDHSLPALTLVAGFKVGALEDPAPKSGLSGLTLGLLRTGGTAKHTADEVNDRLESLGAVVELEAQAEEALAYAHCFRKDASPVLGLLAEMLATPRFAPDRVELARTQKLSTLKASEDQPIQVAIRGLRRLVYNGKGLGVMPTQATVQAITEADLKGFAATWIRPNNMVVGLSGDLSLAEAKQLMQEAFGAWQAGKPGAYERGSNPTQAHPGIYLQRRDKLAQSVVLAGMQGLRADDPDSEALEIAFHILGQGEMSNRIFNTIRTKHGLAYNAGAVNMQLVTVDGLMVGLATTKAESTTRVVELMREEMVKLAQDGITAEELETTKKALLNKEVFATATTRDAVGNATELAIFGRPLDTRARKLEKLQALTLQQVNDAVKRRFKPGQLRFFVLADPAGIGADKLERLGAVEETKG